MKRGPIIIEDDPDDKLLFKEVFEELEIKNELKFFDQAQQMIDYLLETKDTPFIILTAVDLPQINGTELRQIINDNEHLRKKAIPFIFLTTHTDPTTVKNAYNLMVQGYIEKDINYDNLKNSIKVIINYWELCKHPNNTR